MEKSEQRRSTFCGHLQRHFLESIWLFFIKIYFVFEEYIWRWSIWAQLMSLWRTDDEPLTEKMVTQFIDWVVIVWVMARWTSHYPNNGDPVSGAKPLPGPMMIPIIQYHLHVWIHKRQTAATPQFILPTFIAIVILSGVLAVCLPLYCHNYYISL